MGQKRGSNRGIGVDSPLFIEVDLEVPFLLQYLGHIIPCLVFCNIGQCCVVFPIAIAALGRKVSESSAVELAVDKGGDGGHVVLVGGLILRRMIFKITLNLFCYAEC